MKQDLRLDDKVGNKQKKREREKSERERGRYLRECGSTLSPFQPMTGTERTRHPIGYNKGSYLDERYKEGSTAFSLS